MATTTGTHVNFVKVPTMAKFNDISSKVDGTVYFIVDEKKIHLDGVMYGFNDSDVANRFLELTGGVLEDKLVITNGGNIDEHVNINSDSIKFTSTGEVRKEIVAWGSGALVMYVGETAFEFKDGGFSIKSGQSNDPVKISGVADPVNASDAVNLNYLNANVINKIGADNGIAPLNEHGVVSSDYLPSYVDDVEEYPKRADFPNTGESGKLYIDTLTGFVWRWGGTAYAQVSDGNAHLTLGITSGTAYQGNLGKIAYDHSQLKTNNPHQVTASQVGLGNVQNYGQAIITDAEAGTRDDKYMTPLTTKYAVQEFAPRLSWEVVS